MLRTDFPFRTDHWPARAVALVLGEAFLGFLAIVSAALTLFPMLFNVTVPTNNAIEAAQWAIIGWFAVEYLAALACARSKRLFLLDPWRWVDLATIVIPLASLLPEVSHLLRSSPILRLIRLARLLTLGVRATGIVVRDRRHQAIVTPASEPVIITRRGGDRLQPREPATHQELLQWLSANTAGWFHVAGPNQEDLGAIGRAAGLPTGFLETHLVSASHPHVAAAPGCVALFVWSPHADADGTVERRPILMLLWRDRVLSFSRTPLTAFEPVETGLPALDTAALPIRALTLLLQRITTNNESLIAGFEQQLRSLEDVPLRESRPVFFEQTFRLKKHLSAAQWDLWRLKAVLAQLTEHRMHVPGMSEATGAAFARFATNVDYLYETVINTREDVLSVIDLHINVVSFDMNRVMRVLAVVSCLGLIPAVVGGLFGMNLIDNPWHFTLPQVSFGIFFAMLLGLYFFFVKGWLR